MTTPATFAETAIELRVERIAHLFDAFDPFPIPSRDLAKTAEDFIVGWARELPKDTRLKIVVYAPDEELKGDAARSVKEALARHFTYRAASMSGDLKELFHRGRVSLGIGLSVLAACIVAGRAASGLAGASDFGRFLVEGLFILGWVANWRPMEIFLYDWWPIEARRRLYRRLAEAPVEVLALSARS